MQSFPSLRPVILQGLKMFRLPCYLSKASGREETFITLPMVLAQSESQTAPSRNWNRLVECNFKISLRFLYPNHLLRVIIHAILFHWQDVRQGHFCCGVPISLIQSFPSHRLVAVPRLDSLVCPGYLFIAWGGKDNLVHFPRTLARS